MILISFLLFISFGWSLSCYGLTFSSSSGSIDQSPTFRSFSDPVVEKLDELEKKSYFCLRIPIVNDDKLIDDDEYIDNTENFESACVVECKRKDGRALGSSSLVESADSANIDNDDETCIRRAFAFTASPRLGVKYDGPCLIHCRQLPFSYGKLGGTVWFAAVALAQYICIHPEIVEGKKVLELGAGIGCPGIVASKCGAKSVCLTEFGFDGDVNDPIVELQGDEVHRLLPSALLSNLSYNAHLNNLDESLVSVKHLDWFDFVKNEQNDPYSSSQTRTEISTASNIDKEEFDLVIGSDLVNWEDDVRPLISTLKHFLSNKKTRALVMLSVENRKALPTFMDLIEHEFSLVETKKIYIMQYDEMKPILLITLGKANT